jgi:hypothetical protein
MKAYFHGLISFLPVFHKCQINSIPSAPKLISWQTGVSKLDSTLLYNHFTRTTQKIQRLYCWVGVFTTPLHSNRSYSIVACVFVAAGMCLPSRCLAMNVYSDFTVPSFGCYVTIRTKFSTRSSFLVATYCWVLALLTFPP